MDGVPLFRAGGLSPYFEALDAIGVAVDRHLERAGLPRRHRLQPDALIVYQQGVDFMAGAHRAMDLRTLPETLIQHSRLECLGSWGHALGRTGTLGALLGTSARTSWMFSSGEKFWLEDRRDDILWCHRFDPRLEMCDGEGIVLQLLSYMVNTVRSVLGATWAPREITVAVPLSVSLERLGIDAPARVSGVTSLAIRRNVLATPTPSLVALAADDGGRALECLSANAPASDLVGSVRQALHALGYLEIGALAEITGLPVRTLQRRLSEAGVSLRFLVQEVQLAEALRLMQDPARKLVDIAFELGFSDPAHFTRAFRRWTGVSPRTFRNANGLGRAGSGAEWPTPAPSERP